MDLLPWDAPCKTKGQPKLTSCFALVETVVASMELLSQFLYAITAGYRLSRRTKSPVQGHFEFTDWLPASPQSEVARIASEKPHIGNRSTKKVACLVILVDNG
jgi:hypothetical protein